MSQVIIDLATKRDGMAPQGPLLHPAGVTLPFEGPSDAALIIPEIRRDIRSGDYSVDLIGLLPDAVKSGDRVLVIGAGLGVVSSLVARTEGVKRVIAIEANTTLIPYLERVHEVNGVADVETVNAVLVGGKKGRVPFFTQRDLRLSSLLPNDPTYQQVMMVPFMDVNLILTEEQISLIVCDIPVASAQILAAAELISVDRILVNCTDDPALCWEDDGICALLVTRGYIPEPAANAVLFRRADTMHQELDDAASASGQQLDDDQDDDEDEWDEDEDDVAALDEEQERLIAEGLATDEAERAAAFAAEHGLDPALLAALSGEDDTGDWEPTAPKAQPLGTAPSTPRREPRSEPSSEHRDVPEMASPAVNAAAVVSGSGEGRAGRLLGLVFLAACLAFPLILIDMIATDRAGSRIQVAQEVGATWGGAQSLTGPFLVIPVEATSSEAFTLADGSQGTRMVQKPAAPLVVLPETLEIESDLTTEMRRRGVFEMPVYHGRHAVSLDFDLTRISGIRLDELLVEGEALQWDRAELGLGITEPWALKGALTLRGPNGAVGFESGSGFSELTGIHARTGDPRGMTDGWRFDLELDGSQQFQLTPAGRVTDVRIRSDWAHTNFSGAFQPTLSQTGDTGFVAEWSVPQMAHALPQAFRGTDQLSNLQGAGFGVDLLLGADLYDGTKRAAKFGFLMLILTFGAVFLMEKTTERPPHLVQYGLIGFAQCAFFALFMSLAEQIGMGPAYALAAVATTALLTGYTGFGMRLGQRSIWLAAALGLLYAVMYLVLSTDENMLLMGAVLAFLATALTMWGTSNEDWSTALRGLWGSKTTPDAAAKATES